MKELINNIRKTNQIDIYSVNDQWVVQLFELEVCPNDIGASCIWENNGYDLEELLKMASEYAEVNNED